MINIEKNVETALYKSAYQGLRIEFEPLRGKKFHITSLDLVEGSFQIKMTSTSTNNMQIGNMSANDLSMELMNPTDSWGIGKFDDVYFCGATMRLKLLVYDQVKDEMTETPFGVYIIDNQPRALDTIKITAFNNVIRLDTPFKAEGLPTSMTLYDLVDEGLRRAGLAHDDSIQIFPSNVSGRLDVTKIKSEQVITWRQVVKWCCECMGVNAISDENGIIKFVFYDKYTPDVLRDEDDLNLETEDGEILLIDDTPTTDFQITPALRYADNSSEIAEEDVVITGFQFKVDDALYPEDAVMDYGLQSENNLVFYALNERGRIKMAKDVNEKLAGFTYRPFKCNMLSFPHLQTCDSVTYIKDGKQYHSIITDIVYKLNGDMTLTAKGKNKEQKAWEVLGALTPKQQAIIDSVSRKIDTTRQDLNAREQFLILFNEAITGSMGFYSTVVEKANGAKISYMHDKSTLEDSKVIYTFSEQGFAWTTDGWNNGEPIWHYGFDKNGNAILNTIYAYKLTADVIVSGFLRSKNGASCINMDNGTFSFRSVKDAWMDLDTNEMNYSYEDKLTLDESGTLGVYGELRSTQSNFSAFIGNDSDYDAEVDGLWMPVFRLTKDLSRKDKDVFQIAECVLEDDDSIELRLHSKDTKFVCEPEHAYITNYNAYLGVYKGDIEMSTWAHSNYVWINFFAPLHGNPTKYYKFGAGNGADYGGIQCDGLYAKSQSTIGGLDPVSNYTLTVWGQAYSSGGWIQASARTLKENIKLQTVNAVDKISKLKFYSYDYKNADQPHVDIGLMVDEAPKEIQSTDGQGIDLYSYISLTAKAVQELTDKVAEQEKRITELEAKIAEL